MFQLGMQTSDFKMSVPLSRIFLSLIILICFVFLGSQSASLEGERTAQRVTIKFYRLSTSGWQAKSAAFKAQIRDQANVYCELYTSSCGLTSWDANAKFNTSHVGLSATPNGKDLIVTFYIDFPSGANVSSVSQTLFVLIKVATVAIARRIKTDIEHAVGSYVTYVDEQYYGIPIDNKSNGILIPLSFAVVAAIIILAISLHFWHKRNGRRKVQKEITSSKITPIHHTLGGAAGKNIDTHDNLKGSNVNNTQKDSHNMKKMSTPPVQHHNRPSAMNEFMEVDETQHNNAPAHALPPMASAEDNEGDTRKDKKKKKKKKKKRQHRDSEDMGYDPTQSDNEAGNKTSNTAQERLPPNLYHDNSLYDSDPI